MEALQKLCNRIEDNLGQRIDRLEDNLEKLEATVDSLQYKFIDHFTQCDYHPVKSSLSSSSSNNQSVNPPPPKTETAPPPPSPPSQAAPPPPSPSQAAPPPPPPPTTEAAPPPPSPPSQAAPPPSPPPTTEAAPPPPPSQAAPPPPTSQAAPPPPSQAAPPPPPPTSQAAPPPPTAEVQDAQALIKYQPHKKKGKRDDKKEIDTVEEKKTKQDVISVDRIEILPRVAEINLEYPGKIFLTTEQQTFMDEYFKNVLLALYLRFTCALLALSLCFHCALPALSLRFTCALPALYLRFTCAFTALSLRFTCALPVPDLRFFVLFSRDDVIFQSGNILINRGDIDDILTNQYFSDNHVDSFAFLLSEKIRIIPKEFQKYLYISPLYRLYKCYKHDYQMFIQHITPDSVRESKLIVQPICFQSHWVLIVGKLKEKVWKLYDSLPNPEHKAIYTEVIKQIHEDKTESNEYDYGIFVCKYMERAILKKKTDWASLKEWQKYMPKFRAELGYALYFTTKM
ncbi:hypothetical protein IEQ34_018177 [Dendrobium chrysotoxum]|uniref:Ubiquitin-like protease family profile domain-containing protein n=1 Tax=Dendrobium chrysotoxum TaxID=161865 RepID=A0AAV7GDM8_DENCH|nr:hypothetical protein IEQ34_018177 [Dendrobium chrysotoxum]